MSLNRRTVCLAAALAGMLPTLLLLAAGGEQADTDALAHLIWARQLLDHGEITIAEDGVCHDPSLYWPNTVPKPLPLLLSIPAAGLGGAGTLQALWIVMGFLALVGAARLGMRIAGPGAAWICSLGLGLNPAWVMLVLRCRPAAVLIGIVVALPAGRASALDPLAALVRPEGIFVAGWRALRSRSATTWLLLIAAVAVWPALNLAASGDPLWSAREVRVAVEQMAYPTPGPATYPLLLGRRLFLVAGPVLALVLLRFYRRWPLWVPVSAYAALLWVSLAGGSLVLPRYLDPLVLMAVPWSAAVLWRMTRGWPGRVRLGVAGLALASACTLWPSALGAWRSELDLQRSLEDLGFRGWEGRLAVTELLVPRIAESAGLTDLSAGFVALDRAAWKDADLDDMGVGSVAVFPHTPYLPEHTREYLERRGIEPDTLGTEAKCQSRDL